MMPVVGVVLWLAVGAAVGIFEARHGHWKHSWLLTSLLGPAALLVVRTDRRRRPVAPRVLQGGRPGTGGAAVLIGVDGSAGARAAVLGAMRMFDPRRVTLAAVLDVETARPPEASLLNPEPWPEQVQAEGALADLAGEVERATGIVPETVVLAGAPADALATYAAGAGFDVIAVGHRGAGLSKLVLGSCATTLTRRSPVPVLLVPDAAPAASDPVAAEGEVPCP